jgi:hypothetical protein
LADAQVAEGLRIAMEQGATRVENRAKLAASESADRLSARRGDYARDRAEEYFRKAGEARLAVDALLILSRAHGDLEHFEQASAMAASALTFAQQANDNVRTWQRARESGGPAREAWPPPEALAVREQINELHRRMKDQAQLPRDLTNYASC